MEENKYYNQLFTKEDNTCTVNPNIYINNSILSEINPDQAGSPKKFVRATTENKEKLDSTSLSTGKAIHKYLESPEDFIVTEFDMPTSQTKIQYIKSLKFEGVKLNDEPSEEMMIRLGQQAGYKIERNKAGTAWNGIHNLILNDNEKQYLSFLYDSEGKIELTSAQKEQIDRMKESLNNHKRVSQYLFGSKIYVGNMVDEEGKDFKRFKELAIYWQEKVGERTINRKALLDVLLYYPVGNTMTLIDMKSTSSSIHAFSSNDTYKGTFESWRMYRQLAFYNEAIENLYNNPTAYAITNEGKEMKPYGKPCPTIYNYIVPIETFGDFNTTMIPINYDWILYGKREVSSLINRIVWHMDKNQWDYSKEEVENGMTLPITKMSDIPRLKIKNSVVSSTENIENSLLANIKK